MQGGGYYGGAGCSGKCGGPAGARMSTEEMPTRLGIGSRRFGGAAAVTAVVLAFVASAASAHSAPAVCQASVLSASFGGQGATQTIVGALTLTNIGTSSCRLTGRPLISMRTGETAETLHERPWNSSVFPAAHFSNTILLSPRRSASVRFQWQNWCNPNPRSSPLSGNDVEGRRPSQILVTIAPGAPPISANVPGGLRHLALPRCLVPDRPASSIYVTLWTTP